MNQDSSFLDEPSDLEHGITNVWDYARIRLRQIAHSPAARLECGVVVLALAALFLLPLLSWWRHWLQPTSIQFYAVWVFLLIPVWLWLNRFRIVLPELDSLNERFTERSVIRFFLEQEPEPQKRLRSPLILGCLLTPLALRMGDASFTGLAFVMLLIGIVAYRFGTSLLRLLFFPFCMLFTLIPAPGSVLDGLGSRLNTFFFKIATHLLQIAGYHAELPGVEPNPLLMLGDVKIKTYRMFAGAVGTGAPEAGVFLVWTLFYLSLLDAPFRSKMIGLFFGLFWIGLLVSLRLFAIAALQRVVDEDTLSALIPVTRWLLPVLAFGGQILIMRGLKCRQFHNWVSV